MQIPQNNFGGFGLLVYGSVSQCFCCKTSPYAMALFRPMSWPIVSASLSSFVHVLLLVSRNRWLQLCMYTGMCASNTAVCIPLYLIQLCVDVSPCVSQ